MHTSTLSRFRASRSMLGRSSLVRYEEQDSKHPNLLSTVHHNTSSLIKMDSKSVNLVRGVMRPRPMGESEIPLLVAPPCGVRVKVVVADAIFNSRCPTASFAERLIAIIHSIRLHHTLRENNISFPSSRAGRDRKILKFEHVWIIACIKQSEIYHM